MTSKVTVTAAVTGSNNVNDRKSDSVNNSDVTNSVSVLVGGIATTRLTLAVKQPVFLSRPLVQATYCFKYCGILKLQSVKCFVLRLCVMKDTSSPLSHQVMASSKRFS